MSTVILQIDNDKGDGRFVKAFANIQAVQDYLHAAYTRSTAPVRPRDHGRDTIYTIHAIVEIPDPDHYFSEAVHVYAPDMSWVRYWNSVEDSRGYERYTEVKEGGVYYVEVEVRSEINCEETK